MGDSRALIVLATYNGANYLKPQIDSLRAQTVSDWQLLVSDDGSTDATMSILHSYARADERIEVVEPRRGKRGHVANFEHLLSRLPCRNEQAVFLCDQDDIWLPSKLETLLGKFDGSSAVFSDVEVFHDVQVGGYSFLGSMGLKPPRDLRRLIAQNAVVGCSLAVRSELLELALPFPHKLENHDWWLAICAMAEDGLGYTDQRLVRYRQHDANAIGEFDWKRSLTRIPELLRRQRRNMESKVLALEELQGRLAGRGQPVPEAVLEYVALFRGVGRFRSAWRLATGPFCPSSKALLGLQLAALLSR